MERTYINTLQEKNEESVFLCGFVDTIRDHGKLLFFELRDMTGTVQCLVREGDDAYETAKKLRPESTVTIRAIVKERPTPSKSNKKQYECVIEEIMLLSLAEELPFDKDVKTTIETLFDNRPLTLRSSTVREIFKVQEKIVYLFREYFRKNNFTEFQAPKLTGGDAEGGAGVFRVPYFNHEATLATSPQLYKQILVGVFERVYTVGNVYRAEKHATSRHLNEYTSLDFELGFIDDHTDIMKHCEALMRHICENIKGTEKVLLPKKPFPVYTLKEAQKIIKVPPAADLEPQHEMDLCTYAEKEYGSSFIFITHYPVEKRPMYSYEDEAMPGYTKGFDLLFKGIEIVTGGQRIHSYEKLKKSIEKRGLSVEKFSFYLQAFKYGLPPHGGAGIGLERVTAKLMGLKNIKEAALFPRDLTRIDKPFN